MNNDQQHLSQIETRWSMIAEAHRDNGRAASDAQQALLARYSCAVHQYLLRVTRDPDAAADLTQEFALRFLRGDFRRVDPRRGRFRDFLKTAVIHLAVDAHRRARRRPEPLPAASEQAASYDDLAELESEFFVCWREELMRNAWTALSHHEAETGQPYHTVLRLRADQPELRSADLAHLLGARLGRTLNAGWVRQTLLRARTCYVNLLVAEVARSLGDPSPDEVDEELMNLDLWSYCRGARASADRPD